MADGQLTTGGTEPTDQAIGILSGEPTRLVTDNNAAMLKEIAAAGPATPAGEPVPALETEPHLVAPASITETAALTAPASNGLATPVGEQPVTALAATPIKPTVAMVQQIITAYHANDIAALQNVPEAKFDTSTSGKI